MEGEHKIFGRIQCTDGFYYQVTYDGRCNGCGKKLRAITESPDHKEEVIHPDPVAVQEEISEDEELEEQLAEYQETKEALSDSSNSQSTCDSQ
jgi:transcription initiation factor IIE alpha subunit